MTRRTRLCRQTAKVRLLRSLRSVHGDYFFSQCIKFQLLKNVFNFQQAASSEQSVPSMGAAWSPLREPPGPAATAARPRALTCLPEPPQLRRPPARTRSPRAWPPGASRQRGAVHGPGSGATGVQLRTHRAPQAALSQSGRAAGRAGAAAHSAAGSEPLPVPISLPVLNPRPRRRRRPRPGRHSRRRHRRRERVFPGSLRTPWLHARQTLQVPKLRCQSR